MVRGKFFLWGHWVLWASTFLEVAFLRGSRYLVERQKTPCRPVSATLETFPATIATAAVALQRLFQLMNPPAAALSTDLHGAAHGIANGHQTCPHTRSGHRWDTAMFSDRERQEKFNKLMGMRGETKVEQNFNNQSSNDSLRAEKEKELQMDLEKQYTAGLRRRDGRTVCGPARLTRGA
ncbi:hypothetical protein JHK85_004558 [Glycine max]|nr:hypothetical protein JHK85_004558 [Glycine max]